MIDETHKVVRPFGWFIRGENGLVYFNKGNNLQIDRPTIEDVLQTVCQLDDSGKARLILIQGCQVEYTFEAQHYLIKSDALGGLACVARTHTQRIIAETVQSMATLLRANYPFRVFDDIVAAEAWLLHDRMHH